MKGFVSFIAAATIYFIAGIICWNIVCSVMDIGKLTLVQLADYRLLTYSALTVAVSLAVWAMTDSSKFASLKDYNAYSWMVVIVAVVNYIIGVAVNHWESVWDVVATIFTVIYNVVNIGLLTLYIYIPLSDTSSNNK